MFGRAPVAPKPWLYIEVVLSPSQADPPPLEIPLCLRYLALGASAPVLELSGALGLCLDELLLLEQCRSCRLRCREWTCPAAAEVLERPPEKDQNNANSNESHRKPDVHHEVVRTGKLLNVRSRGVVR